MVFFLNQMINGLTVGAVYALVALGYTMVYGVMRLINFAHGEFFMIGSYLGYTTLVMVLADSGLPLWLMLLIATAASTVGVAILGVSVEQVAYRPLRKSGRLAAVVSALGVSQFLQNAAMLVWGARYQAYPPWSAPEATWRVASVNISFMQVLIMAVSLLLMVGLYMFVQRTTAGTAIRATAIDHDSKVDGHQRRPRHQADLHHRPRSRRHRRSASGPVLQADPLQRRVVVRPEGIHRGHPRRIGNIPGAMLGGLLLGILEMLGAGYISAAWKDVMVFSS